MSDSSIPPSIADNNPQAATSEVPVLKPRLLSPKRRWLVISAITVLALLIISLVLAMILQPDIISFGGPSQKQSTSSASPTPTINAEEQQFFAQLPQSMLYYSYAQTSSSRNMYQADPTDTQRRSLSMGYPGVNQFKTSPDGQKVIRYSSQHLQWANSQDPNNFKNVYTAPTDKSISSVQISSNSQQIALIASQTTNNQTISQLILVDGQDSAEMTVITSDATIDLVGFIVNQAVWYVENRHGQLTNLSRYDLVSHQTTQVWSSLNFDQALQSMQYSTDMRFAYLVTKTKLTQFDLAADNSNKALYEVNTSCTNNKTNDSAITAATIAPSTNLALLQVKIINCPNQKTSLTNSLMLIDNQTGQIIRQIDQNIAFTKGFWSTHSDYVWLTISPDNNYMIKLSDLASQPLPDSNRQTVNKEKLYFLGWLTGVQ